ncbi:MAG TPA: chromosomal replication initiator protein DnaA [Acidimicrobiales bacterium]|nr:chromosomal replication initiator protein DnaA [Acidimicrobiales bacterium]
MEEIIEENATFLWESCATAIKSQVSEVVWQVTFSSVIPVEIKNDQLVLQVPSTVVRDRIEGRYKKLVSETLSEISDDQFNIAVNVVTEPISQNLEEVDAIEEADGGFVLQKIEEFEDNLIMKNLEEKEDSKLVNNVSLTQEIETDTAGTKTFKYTFNDFVIGSSNRFAHAAALAVAETPGRSYNPLFIYGDAGLGKTHLLQAVGNYVTDHYKNHEVRYVSSETFMNRFVEAIRNKTLPEFKQHFREIDVLLVDDIQFMEGKEGLQEEFFHTFNTIQQAGGQIVLSSDRPPDSIPTLEDRLRSRFKMGLVTDIQAPDLETRLAILSKKTEENPGGIIVPDEVLQFIAENITENIRELEGALTRVSAYAKLNHEPCTKALAITVLGDLISSNAPRPITPELIFEQTTEMYGFSKEELIGGSRRRPLVTARQVAMYIFRELTDLSYPSIAREFGGRDHTTVIHAVEKIKGLMAERREIYDQVTSLISALRDNK